MPSKQEVKKDQQYICQANIRTKGKDRDYNRGEVLNAEEYRLVPKELKKKFITVEQMRFAGDVESLQRQLQDAYLKIQMLEDQLKPSQQGAPITTETGGQPGAEDK